MHWYEGKTAIMTVSACMQECVHINHLNVATLC